MVNPLHYKRLVTKKRIHATFILLYIFFVTNITCYFIFLRKGTFILLKECVVQYILQYAGYLFVVACIFTCIILMFINCIIITIKLRKMKNIALGSKTNTQENDHKLTYATWMTLKLYLLFVVPNNFLGVVSNFLQQPYPMFYDMLLDISYLLFYMNNVVNPFVYYAFLKDFKEGYQTVLCCKNNESNFRNRRRRSFNSIPTMTLPTISQ